MGNLYANTGCDLDLILYKGTGPGATYIYDDTGTDIGLKYTKGSTGYDLGFKVADGTDVGRILGGDVVSIWRSSQCKDTSSSDAINDAWHYVTMFSSDKSNWKKIEQDVETLSIGTHTAGTSYFSTKSSYGAYAYHLMFNFDEADAEVTLGSPSSGDGKVWIAETRSPNKYTKNFVIVGQGGSNVTKEYVESGSGSDGDYESHWEYTPIYSSIQLKIAIKVGGTVTKEYYAKLSF